MTRSHYIALDLAHERERELRRAIESARPVCHTNEPDGQSFTARVVVPVDTSAESFLHRVPAALRLRRARPAATREQPGC
jgi:hypothetical protein